jgi:hypothetical protein
MGWEPGVIAAIDFGTHGSGYAWTARTLLNDDPLTRRIHFYTGYTGVRPDLCVAGGLLSLAERDRARRIITGYLGAVRLAALADIAATGTWTEEEIRWCITIPGTWSEPEKSVMRQAAYDAGFPADDGRLLLSVEPESAAVYCQLRKIELEEQLANVRRAVLEGAVHYAYDPQELACRRSKYTYGFAVAMPWEAGVDSPVRRFCDEDQVMMCRDRFAIAVHRMDQVAVDEPVTFLVEPAFTDSAEVTIQLFRTRTVDPRYVDEEGCELAGKLTVDVSDTVGHVERPIALLLYFGRSQIQVEAIDLTTNKKLETATDFAQLL